MTVFNYPALFKNLFLPHKGGGKIGAREKVHRAWSRRKPCDEGKNHPRTRVRGSSIGFERCDSPIFKYPPLFKNLFLPPCGGGQGGGCRSVQRQQPPSDSRPRLVNSFKWMYFDDFQISLTSQKPFPPPLWGRAGWGVTDRSKATTLGLASEARQLA